MLICICFTYKLIVNGVLSRVKKGVTCNVFIYLFGVLCRFQHCTGHITTGSWKGRGNQYIQFVGVLYCKLPTNGKQLPAFPLEAMPGTEPQTQRWEARGLPLCHRGPCYMQCIMTSLWLLLYISYVHGRSVELY